MQSKARDDHKFSRRNLAKPRFCRVERHHSLPNVFVDLLAVKFDGDKELHAARQAELTYVDYPRSF